MKNTMIRGFSLAILVSLATCFTAPQITRGEDAPAAPSIDVKFSAEPEIPKRQLTFEESKEEFSIELFAADPKLLDQRYVATIVLWLPDIDPYRSTFSLVSQELQPLYWSSLFGRMRVPIDIPSIIRPPSALFKRLAENTPAEQKPAEEILSLLLDDKYHFRVVERRRQPGGDNVLELQILGPTVETTKAMSLALLDLYDYGLSHPIQEHLIADMQQRKARLPEMLANFKAEQPKGEPLAKRLEDFEPISDDTITDLRNQRRLIAVDIAGAQARIDACAKILMRNDIRGQKTSEQVESIKITAEIELVGLAARQDAIGKIIDKGNQRRDLAYKLRRQTSTTSNLRRQLENEIRAIGKLEEARKHNMPLAVADNKIRIRPIKWEPANTARFGESTSRGR